VAWIETPRGRRQRRRRIFDEHRRDLISLTYAAAALLAAVGGVLMAPLYNVAYDMGIGIKAFAVAILGGLTNPLGVVIAGLGYGPVEACATTWLGSSSTQIVTFSVVIVALAFAPNDFFGIRTRIGGRIVHAAADANAIVIEAHHFRSASGDHVEGNRRDRPATRRARHWRIGSPSG